MSGKYQARRWGEWMILTAPDGTRCGYRPVDGPAVKRKGGQRLRVLTAWLPSGQGVFFLGDQVRISGRRRGRPSGPAAAATPAH